MVENIAASRVWASLMAAGMADPMVAFNQIGDGGCSWPKSGAAVSKILLGAVERDPDGASLFGCLLMFTGSEADNKCLSNASVKSVSTLPSESVLIDHSWHLQAQYTSRKTRGSYG